jgi:hypothetical protein
MTRTLFCGSLWVFPDNIIREALKQRILHQSSTRPGNNMPSSASTNNLVDLHMHATHKCRLLLPTVLVILKRHLQTPTSALLPSDTGLIRDGCAFAGFMLAHGDLEGDSGGESLQSVMSLAEGVEVCIRTLDAMRWTFSESAKTKQTLVNAWDARKLRDSEHHRRHGPTSEHYGVQPGPSHQWLSQVSPHGQPFEGNNVTSLSSGSSYYSPEQNYETQPWMYSSSSGAPSTQPMSNIDPHNSSPTFSPDEWFGYNPAC